MKVLVLGGTAWVGGVLAAEAVQRGHEVTCLARGSAAVPRGARLVRADRGRPGAYADAAVRWDVVFDVARDPDHVRGAVDVIDASWYGFVSSVNVYADPSRPHQDETAALLDPDAPPADPGEAYGIGKVSCEHLILERFGARALIARAGLIGGPGDPTGRSTYWPWRFAHPSADSVLVPDAAQRSSEVLDVRDLATWMLAAAERAAGGVFDVVGPEIPLGGHLATARSVSGHTGAVEAAPESWLLEQGVREWMGPRSLPLWLADPGWQGFTSRDGSAARAAGLVHRPLADTLRDALASEEQRPEHPHGAGLTDDEERALLDALAR